MLLLLMVVALLVGVLGARLGAGVGRLAPSLAGGLLLAIVLGDLLPDALSDGASSTLPGGVAPVVGVAGAAAVVGTLFLHRRRGSARRADAVGCCPGATGRVAATALATHGAAEGLVVGLGAGLGEGTAVAVAGVVALHRLAEGFALSTALRRSGSGRGATVGLVVLAAVSPVVGVALAGEITLDQGAGALVTAALGGLLASVAVALLSAGRRPGQARVSRRPAPLTAAGLEPGVSP